MNKKQNFIFDTGLMNRFSRLSLRSKLVFGNLLITFIAIIATTYYALNRAQASNAYLTEQLGNTVFQESETKLNALATQNASEISVFFEIAQNDLTSLGITTQSFLSQGVSQNADSSSRIFTRLSTGSWDNPNTDKASIFIPNQSEIPNNIFFELNTLRQLDYIAPILLERNPDIISIQFGSLNGEIIHYPNTDLAGNLPSDFDVTQTSWFTAAGPNNNPEKNVVWAAPYQSASANGLAIISSVPVYDTTKRFRGVIAMELRLARVDELVSKIGIGKTGYAFMINQKGNIIVMPDESYADFGAIQESLSNGQVVTTTLLGTASFDVFQVLTKMISDQAGVRAVQFNGVEKYVAYHPILGIDYSLGVVVPRAEMDEVAISTNRQVASETAKTFRNTVIILFVVLAASLLASLWIGNTITTPLVSLTNIAKQITSGDLNATAKENTSDEIGVLAGSFNIMTSRIRELINSLEDRVNQRTAELDIANRYNSQRARQFEAITQIVRAISSIQDLGNLLPYITQVVSEQFGVYHTGIFLLDTSKEFAVLRASNSEGGKKMLSQGHKLQVGQTGIVGYVTATGQPRIALDVGDDAVYFDNPNLPDTHSEIALPLRYAGQVIGALDVQSLETGAFSHEDTEVLITLADQISIAINNTLMLEEARKAFSESQNRAGESTFESWKVMQPKSLGLGFVLTDSSVQPLVTPLEGYHIQEALTLEKSVSTDLGDGVANLAIPIRLRQQVIGVMNLRSRENSTFTQDEIDIAESVSERLSLAIETATLLQTTQHRADIERVATDISSKISSSTRFDTILQIAAQELSRALGGSDVTVQIEPTAMTLGMER